MKSLLFTSGCNVAAPAGLAMRGIFPSPLTATSVRRRLSLSSLPSSQQEPLHSHHAAITSSCSSSLLSSSSRLSSLHSPQREKRIYARHLSSALPSTSPPPQQTQSSSSSPRSSPPPLPGYSTRRSLRSSLPSTGDRSCDRTKIALSVTGIGERLARRRRRNLASNYYYTCATQAWGGDEERRSRRRKRKGESCSSSFTTGVYEHGCQPFPSHSLFSSSFSLLPSCLHSKSAAQQQDRKRLFSSSPLLLRQNLLPFPLVSSLSHDKKIKVHGGLNALRRRDLTPISKSGVDMRGNSPFFSSKYHASHQLHRGEEGKCIDTALRLSFSSLASPCCSLLEGVRRKADFSSASSHAAGERGVSAATHEKEKRQEEESLDRGIDKGYRSLNTRNGVKEDTQEEEELRKVLVDRSEGKVEEEEEDDFQPCVQDEDSLALMQQMCESFNERRHRPARRKSQPHTLHIVQDEFPAIISPASSSLSFSFSSCDSARQARENSSSSSSSPASSPRFDYLSPSSSSSSSPCSSSTFSFTFDPLPSSSACDPGASYHQISPSSSSLSSTKKERRTTGEEFESKGSGREEGRTPRVFRCYDGENNEERRRQREEEEEEEEEEKKKKNDSGTMKMNVKNGYAGKESTKNNWEESSSSSLSSSSCPSKCRNVQENDREEFLVVDLEKLRKESMLTFLPVQTVLRALVDKHPGMYVWREGFVHTVQQLLADAGIVANTPPTETSLNQAFDVLDKSDNEIIDLLEAVRGLPQLCRASHLDRIQALFALFDRRSNSKLHFDEMMEVFCFIYRVMLTPSVVCQFKQACLHFSTIDDLALHTTQHLFSGRYKTHREKSACRDREREEKESSPSSLQRGTLGKNGGWRRTPSNSHHSNNSSTSPHSPSTSSSSYAPQLFSCFGGGRLSRSISFRYSQRNSCSSSSSSSSSSSQRKKVFCLEGGNEGREDEEQDCCGETSSICHSDGSSSLRRQQGANKKSESEVDQRRTTGRGGGGGATSYHPCNASMGYSNDDEKNRTRAVQGDNHRSRETNSDDSSSQKSKKMLMKTNSDAQVQDDCVQEEEEEVFFSPSSSSLYNKKNGCERSCSQRGYVETGSEETSDEEDEESVFSGKDGLPPWSIVMRRTDATPPRRRRRAGSRSSLSSLSPRCSSSSSSSLSHCHSRYQSVEEEGGKNGEDDDEFFFAKKRNGEKGQRNSITRRDGEEEEITEEEYEEDDDPWKQAIKRKDEYMTFDDFKAICESLPPTVGFSQSSLLELPLIVLVKDVLAPRRSHVVLRRSFKCHS